MEWQPIDTAPLNEYGEGAGPWILIWFEYSHTIHQARYVPGKDCGHWEDAREEEVTQPEYITHWAELPQRPTPQEQQ